MSLLSRISDWWHYDVLKYNMPEYPVLLYKKTRDVKSPARGTKYSAGLDFFVPNDYVETVILPGQQAIIPTGIKVSMDPDWVLIGFNKSGVATKKQFLIGACVIDADYQGEIHINVHNVGTSSQTINAGDKLAQFIMLRVNLIDPIEVDELIYPEDGNERGEGGFGSTGSK